MALDETTKTPTRRTTEIAAVVAFVGFSLISPWLLGEVYPVTVSPMFCDQPTQYCTYQVFDESGKELDPELFGLHLVYDGNPVGMGMGIKAKPTMHEFGMVPKFEDVARHVRKSKALEKLSGCSSVKVVQTVVCCDGGCPKATTFEQTVDLAR